MAFVDVSPYITWLLQIACLAHWHLDRKNKAMHSFRALKVYTVSVLIISVGVMVHSVLCKYKYYHGVHNVLVEQIDTIQLMSVRATHIISVLEALCKFKQQSLLYKKLNEIYGIFERSLNMPLEAKDLRWLLLKPLIHITVIYVGAIGFVLTIKLFRTDPHILQYWYAHVPPLFVCALRYYQVHISIGFIHDRFERLIHLLDTINLNYQMQQHKQQQQQQQYPPTAPTEFLMTHTETGKNVWGKEQHVAAGIMGEQAQLRQLLIIRDIYNRLWELSTLLNACYGISLLTNIGNDFLFLTTNCYWIFLNFGHYARSVHGLLQMAAITAMTLPHLISVLMLAIKCERTIQTSAGVALGLHRIEVDISNDNNNALIEQFSLQLLHQKVYFTAAGFFKIDCSLIYTIVGATTTYLIILIQFYVSDGNKVLRN